MEHKTGRSPLARWRARRTGAAARRQQDAETPTGQGQEAQDEDQSARDSDQRVEARVRARLAQQWAEARATRAPAEPVIVAGESNFAPARVPHGVDLAAAWAWRFIVIAVAGGMILWTLRYFGVVVFPLIVALLIAALVAPGVDRLQRLGLPRRIGSLIVVVLGIVVVGLLLSFVGQQVSQGVSNLSQQVVDGLEQIRTWLRDGPLHASDSQINGWIQQAQDQITSRAKDLTGQLTEVSSAVTHIVAGIFIVLFGTYFFLADGQRIWAWLVRLFPRAGRVQVNTSGQVAWRSLTQFVRATVLVAAVDAIGVSIGALALGVPFVSAIGVLVFLGAFVPMVGATISGVVAILVALVAKGPVVALIMLGVVIAVNQLEAHILQPFLMGRFVSVHPLGVIVAIAIGILAAGIAGAIIAVPLTAALNSVVQYLAEHTRVGEDSVEASRDDPGSGEAGDRIPEDDESPVGD